jgi:hypothetical protein
MNLKELRHVQPLCKVCASPLKDYLEILRLTGNSLEGTCLFVVGEFGVQISRETLRRHMRDHRVSAGPRDVADTWKMFELFEGQPGAAEKARSSEVLELYRSAVPRPE